MDGDAARGRRPFSAGGVGMRRLMWFTIGFTVACAVGVLWVSGTWLLVLGGIALVFFGISCLFRKPIIRKTACVLLGCAIGFAWLWGFDTFYLKPVRQMDGHTKLLTIEVSDYSTRTESGIVAEGKLKLNGKRYSVQFYINDDSSLAPGDRVEGGFRLRYTGGGAENPTFHRGKGIFLLAYPKGSHTVVYGEKIPVTYYAPLIRQRILDLLENLFPEDTSAFAKALLLGETAELDYQTSSALKISGVYHVAAVSGMHVSILFAVICLLCANRRWLIAFVGIPVLFLFAAVAGFTPSIVRACIMQTLMIFALLADREYDPPTALAAAVLILLAVNPISITSVGLQLSVGCMAGIFLFSEKAFQFFFNRIRKGNARKGRAKIKAASWIAGCVSMTLGSMALTMPLTAAYFGNVSIVGILTNLLILWPASLSFYGLVISCVLGFLWMPLGSMLGWLISWPIRFIIMVSNMISKFPLSAVYTNSIYIIAWLIFAYILVTVFLKSKKKHPWTLTVCLLVGLAGALACSWIEPRQDNYRFTALDVGQGQCLILQSQGEYYMVDCGGDSGDTAADRAAQFLFSQGIFRLDGVIVTHYDADHAGGIAQILDRVKVDKVYLPVLAGESDIRDEIVQKHSEIVSWVEESVYLPLPNGSLSIYPSFVTEDDNESSLCILFQPENCDILITGDRSEEGEMALLEYTDLPDLEILVAGHHGSRTSTSWQLLNETRPEIVIISVGEDNRYGHPAWETLERLSLFGCSVYRTDTEGSIIFRG